MEVERVKAHRTKKDEKEMSLFEKFVTEGNEKADALAKEGAMLDERGRSNVGRKIYGGSEGKDSSENSQLSLYGRGMERL